MDLVHGFVECVDDCLDPFLATSGGRFAVGDIEDRCSLDLASYGRLDLAGQQDHVAEDDTVDFDLAVVDRDSVVATCDAGRLEPLDPLGLENHCLGRSVGGELDGWKCRYVGEHPRASSHRKCTCTR